MVPGRIWAQNTFRKTDASDTHQQMPNPGNNGLQNIVLSIASAKAKRCWKHHPQPTCSCPAIGATVRD
jgi:hypothetical protein